MVHSRQDTRQTKASWPRVKGLMPRPWNQVQLAQLPGKYTIKFSVRPFRFYFPFYSMSFKEWNKYLGILNFLISLGLFKYLL